MIDKDTDLLLKAAYEDDGDAIYNFASLGIDLHSESPHGNTALKAASSSGSINALIALLKSGADPNKPITYVSPVDKRVEARMTPLMYADNPAVAEILLQYGSNINALNETGTTALMRAAHNCNIELVNFLLKMGADYSLRQHKRKGKKSYTARELAEEKVKMWDKVLEIEYTSGAVKMKEEALTVVKILNDAEKS